MSLWIKSHFFVIWVKKEVNYFRSVRRYGRSWIELKKCQEF